MNNRRNLNGELMTVKKDARLKKFSASPRTIEYSLGSLPASATRQMMQSCTFLKVVVVHMQVLVLPSNTVQLSGWGNEELIGNLTSELEKNFELTSLISQVSLHYHSYTKKKDISDKRKLER